MSIKDTPNLDAWKLVMKGASILQGPRSLDPDKRIVGVACLQGALRMVFGDASGIDELGNVFEPDPELLAP